MSEKKQKVKANASQKLQALEDKVSLYDRNFDFLAEELDNLRNLVTGLAKRVNATITAGEKGEINPQSVNDIIIQENEKELKSKVDFLIQQGVIKLNNELEINDNTFIVGREITEEGIESNPRVQFAVSSISDEVKSKILGKKAGDSISLSEGNPNLEILEVYELVPAEAFKNFSEENQNNAENS